MAVGLCRGYEDLSIPYMPFIELVQSLQRDCAELDGEVDPAISPLSLFEGNGSGLSGVTNSIAGTGSGQDDASQARFFVSVSTRIIEIAEKDTLRVGEDDVPVSDPVDSITGVEHAVVVRLLAEGNPRP